MLMRCKLCGTTVGRPAATFGLLWFGAGALLTGAVMPQVIRFVSGWGWIVAPVIWYACSWWVAGSQSAWAWARYGVRRCPRCKCRKWTRPYYSGFGL